MLTTESAVGEFPYRRQHRRSPRLHPPCADLRFSSSGTPPSAEGFAPSGPNVWAVRHERGRARQNPLPQFPTVPVYPRALAEETWELQGPAEWPFKVGSRYQPAARFSTPALSRILETWNSTVPSPITRVSAMLALVMPRATRSRTCAWRSASSARPRPPRIGGAGRRLAAAEELRACASNDWPFEFVCRTAVGADDEHRRAHRFDTARIEIEAARWPVAPAAVTPVVCEALPPPALTPDLFQAPPDVRCKDHGGPFLQRQVPRNFRPGWPDEDPKTSITGQDLVGLPRRPCAAKERRRGTRLHVLHAASRHPRASRARAVKLP